MFRVFFLFLVLLASICPSHAIDRPSAQAGGQLEGKLGLRGTWVAEVSAVEPGSVAESIGLKIGDLIVAFNGKKIGDFENYQGFLAGMRKAAGGGASLQIMKYEPASQAYHHETAFALLPRQDVEVGRPMLGIKCGLGFIVLEVEKNGLAYRMGVSAGDFVEKINGHVVANLGSPFAADAIVQEVASSPSREITLLLVRWARVDQRTRIGSDARKVKGTL